MAPRNAAIQSPRGMSLPLASQMAPVRSSESSLPRMLAREEKAGDKAINVHFCSALSFVRDLVTLNLCESYFTHL